VSEPVRSEKRILGVPRNVFALGLTSFLNDLSSEVALKTIPFLLKNLLGAPLWFIGVFEGSAETTSTLAKMPSGWWSDRMGRRKPLTLLGYGLAALTRPLLFLVHVLGSFAGAFIFVLRVMDRVGKGMRGSPRDALLADSCTKEERGHAFGFRHAMDEIGAFSGYGLAALVCVLTLGAAVDLEWKAYWWLVALSVAPAAGAVTVLWLWVKEGSGVAVKPKPIARDASPKPDVSRVGSLGGVFWFLMIIMILFTLGNSADAFLLIKSQEEQVPLFVIFLIFGGTSVMSALVAIPAGKLSDVVGRKALMIAGWLLYAVVYLVFSLNPGPWAVGAMLSVYGLYYGLTDGVARAMVADLVNPEQRGTAFGFFNGAIGVGALPASVIAGALWPYHLWKLHLPFLFGSVMAGIAVVLMVFLPLKNGRVQQG